MNQRRGERKASLIRRILRTTGRIVQKVPLLRAAVTAIRLFKRLEFDYGHMYTALKWSCVDRERNPIPWYTYPAIEYIKQLDFSEKTVFEFGAGNSTLFWGSVAKQVVSVENNAGWYERISKEAGDNARITLARDKKTYVQHILTTDGDFDVIVIDGSHRYDCAQAAISKLRCGGVIILDNSDWHVRAAQSLRESGLIQVDMTGLGPIGHYAWTTTFFFHRQFSFSPAGDRQPQHGIGSLRQSAE